MESIITQKFENSSLFFTFFDAPVYLAENINSTNVLQTKGNNNKQIVFLVQYSENVFLPQNHLEIFNKILNALQLNLDDVLIINIREGKDLPEEIFKNISFKKIISMGVLYSNHNALQTLSLSEIITSEENKKQFWTALKKHLA